MPGSVLIVSAFFTPHRRIGTRRAEKIATRLAAEGWQVTVLTLRPELAPPFDSPIQVPASVEILRTRALLPRQAARALVDRLRPPPGAAVAAPSDAPPPAATLRQRLIQSAGNIGKRALDLSEDLDAWTGWRPFALAAVRNRRFDIVLGTLPPFTAAQIAGEVARRCGAKLVLDYRDPWVDLMERTHDHGRSAKELARQRRVESALLQQAALVLGTSPTICAWLRPRASCPVAFVPSGYETPASRPPPPDAGPATLVYAGSLAYGRSIEPLLAGLARLRGRDGDGHEGGANAARLRLRVCGPDGAAIVAAAKAHGVADQVEDLGNVDLRTANRWVERSAAAVVVVSPGFAYQLPGKVFDILKTGRPMLLLGPRDADAFALVEKHRLGWACAADDHDGIDAALRAIANADRVPPPPPIDVERLSADVAIAEIAALLRQL